MISTDTIPKERKQALLAAAFAFPVVSSYLVGRGYADFGGSSGYEGLFLMVIVAPALIIVTLPAAIFTAAAGRKRTNPKIFVRSQWVMGIDGVVIFLFAITVSESINPLHIVLFLAMVVLTIVYLALSVADFSQSRRKPTPANQAVRRL